MFSQMFFDFARWTLYDYAMIVNTAAPPFIYKAVYECVVSYSEVCSDIIRKNMICTDTWLSQFRCYSGSSRLERESFHQMNDFSPFNGFTYNFLVDLRIAITISFYDRFENREFKVFERIIRLLTFLFAIFASKDTHLYSFFNKACL